MKPHTHVFLAAATVSLAVSGASSAAIAATAPFVYAVNTKTDELSEYSAPPSIFGALTPLASRTIATGPFPYGIAIDPQANSVYVADVGPTNAPAHEVSQYTINPISGQLTPKSPAAVASARGAVEVAVSPNGKSAYAVAHNAVSQYTVDQATGNLIPKSPASVAAGRNAEPIAITPDGKYAYVADCPSCVTAKRGTRPPSKRPPTSTVVGYRINQSTGTLSPIGGVATGTGANGIAITPNGKSLYVAVNSIYQYSINPTTGKLTPKSPATVAAPGTAHDLRITPDGKSAYVVTVANDRISQYGINPRTGALSRTPLSTANTVLHPEAIALSPDGHTVYVTSENEGLLSQFSINATTGKLAPLSPATVATASGSLGIAVTPAAG